MALRDFWSLPAESIRTTRKREVPGSLGRLACSAVSHASGMPLEPPGGLSQPMVQGHTSNLTLWERQPSQPSWSRVGSAWRQSPFLGSPLVSGGVFKAGSAWWGLLCSRAARIYSNSMVASQGAVEEPACRCRRRKRRWFKP